MVAPSAGGSRLPWPRTPTTNPFLTNIKKIRRSKRATNTHKHGPGSYLSDGTRGDSQSHAERDPLRSKDRGLFTYNIEDEIIESPTGWYLDETLRSLFVSPVPSSGAWRNPCYFSRLCVSLIAYLHLQASMLDAPYITFPSSFPNVTSFTYARISLHSFAIVVRHN